MPAAAGREGGETPGSPACGDRGRTAPSAADTPPAAASPPGAAPPAPLLRELPPAAPTARETSSLHRRVRRHATHDSLGRLTGERAHVPYARQAEFVLRPAQPAVQRCPVALSSLDVQAAPDGGILRIHGELRVRWRVQLF